MTEPETETKSGSPSAAIETSQLVASAAEETETAEVGGGEEEVDEHQQQEEKEEEEREEEEREEEEREEEEKEEEEKAEEEKEEEEKEQEEEGPEEEEEAVLAIEEQEQQEQSTAPTKIIVQVGESKENQAGNVSSINISNNKEGPIPKKVVQDEGKKEDEKTRQDNYKKVDEKKIEVTKVEARREKVETKVLKVEDKKLAVGKTVGGVPAAAEQNHAMRDRMEDVEEEEEEELEEEEEEEEVLEEKEEEEEEEEEEQEEEEEEEPEQQLQLQQVLAKEEKMVVEEEEEEDEEDDAGEEDELNERDGSPEEQLAFTRALKAFFKERRMDYKAPKFYGEELNILKLWRAVTSLGGYEQVTAGKLWRKVGEQFQPPKTCTTLSWSFRGFYEKALLEYERYQAGVSYPASSQPDGTISGTDSQAAMSPNTPSSQPSSTPASGSGRMRRDAATRAMHGWHAQRLGNGEVGDPVVKERPVPSKKEKQLKNLVGSKRKETVSLVERAVKVARAKGSKGARSLSLDEVPTGKAAAAVPNKSSGISKKGPKPERTKHVSKVNNMEPMRGLKLVITDDGPPADWVKINAYRTSEGYEIYALVPGLAREEVRIQCEEGGRVVICGSPEQPSNPWGVTAFRKVVNLPSKIDAHHTSAVVTLYGQLFVRVPFAHSFQ